MEAMKGVGDDRNIDLMWAKNGETDLIDKFLNDGGRNKEGQVD